MLILDNQKDVMAFIPGRYMQSLFRESSILKNKKWAYILMMFWCMMLAGVVRMIEDTLLPKILEFALRMLTFKPMKALIHQFGGLGSHCSHCEALGSDVVGGDGSGSWLDMAEFLQCGLKWGGKFAAVVEHSGFSLGG